MQSNHLAIAVHQNQQIAARQLPNVPRCILDGGWIGSGHDGARNRQVCHQLGRAGQHNFAIVLKILERSYGISQILGNPLPNVALHAVLHHQEAQRG